MSDCRPLQVLLFAQSLVGRRDQEGQRVTGAWLRMAQVGGGPARRGRDCLDAEWHNVEKMSRHSLSATDSVAATGYGEKCRDKCRDIVATLAAIGLGNLGPAAPPRRSEEHTSELQSHLNLVCRLLLEKKK